MWQSGILRSWNEARGFGFIAPTQGGAELFVHASAFPRDGSRPVAGETLSYELGQGPDGRAQAVNVVRGMVGTDAPPRRAATTAPRRRAGTNWLGLVLVAAVLIGAGGWGLQRHEQHRLRQQLQALPAVPAEAQPPKTSQPSTPARRCDGRTHCSQMTSCAEATWFLDHCPGTQMDGDGDGVPCEQQWCTSSWR